MKRMKLVTIYLFVGYLGLFFVLNIFQPDRSFSDNENRGLAQLPEFSLENLFFKNYTGQFDSYFTDQFVKRDIWIPIKAYSEILSGKVENNSIYFGKDAYLLNRFSILNQKQLYRNVKTIKKFVDKFAIPLSLALPPTST